MTLQINHTEEFEQRHIATNEKDTKDMLQTVGATSIDSLIKKTVPAEILLQAPLALPPPKTEYDYLNELKHIASKNKVFKSYLGQGYYDTIVPPVIQRNILENPGWYTPYTPYQAEIAQGRLQALLNFQTMIIDLTGMEIANASLLDEGTAAAEAMLMQFSLRKNLKAKTFFVSHNVFPQTIDVLKTRAEPFGIDLLVGDHLTVKLGSDLFGALVQYPADDGYVHDYTSFAEEATRHGILLAVAADLLSLTLLKPPGEWGASVVIGSTQRFGVPMGYGGPHAAYFATKQQYKRSLPGRIIGATQDAAGNYALRMALQTREQHIRRDKATSNICTAQALLAVMASMYAIYHGPNGVKAIAQRIQKLAFCLTKALTDLGYKQFNEYYFDTLKVHAGELIHPIREEALSQKINLRYKDPFIFISLDETTSVKDIELLASIFAKVKKEAFLSFAKADLLSNHKSPIAANLERHSSYLTHEVFNSYHSEHEMLRYIKRLEAKDLSLCHSMIPLGSCTMKLNATTEMLALSWPEFNSIHPFAPLDQTNGYMQIFNELSHWLCTITGFSAVSFQPNSGAQGEYAGLMAIRAFHTSLGQSHRNVALIPSSAHGTNPASAVMAGMKVVIIACDSRGNIDISDLKLKASEHKDFLSCLLITYPSTHGVFEASVKEVCNIIHMYGGQVYMDGANMNAQVGLTSPALIGADVCHLNLHKTFCIPHGGGGPGMGPIAVAKHLADFLPGHPIINVHQQNVVHAVSSAPWGSASILLISHAYISMMGSKGLTNATKHAILNANYMKARLEGHYPILYTGDQGYCAHEIILDCRAFKLVGIDVGDIAKRLMDYGFHAPTVSFPVSGTMMIEPTESEPKHELDRFCDAMIAIRQEIAQVENGSWDQINNPLKNAPHTLIEVTGAHWSHPYTQQQASLPLPYIADFKFWPSVARVNETLGDKNLICSCPPIDAYIETE